MNKLFEGAPTIDDSEQHWIRKGKIGKQCMIFFHDDLDGIMSAIVTRDYLRNHGFRIVGYGIVNYQEGWKNIELDNRYINIALDFAEDLDELDVYIDHHGDFVEKGGDISKMSVKSVKTETSSAYEGICHQLGMPVDSLILNVIDMVDGARYQFYDVDIETILNFNLQDIMDSDNPKLIFAGAFNQLIKRGDYRTLIEVAHNATLSIINIFLMFKRLYPENNPDRRTGIGKEFIADGQTRIQTMINRTRGKEEKQIFTNQKEFYDEFWNGTILKMDGYQIIGNLAFIPHGTWANALRARAIISEDLREKEQLRNHTVNFILLQYGATLQIADTDRGISNIPENELPRLKNGEPIKHLGDYTHYLLDGFKELGYDKEMSKAGGHPGIGNLSNILGVYTGKGNLHGIKWVDLFKNKIINDLSGVRWILTMPWDVYKEPEPKERIINEKVLMINEIRTL
jgi:hypothetical protein